MKFEGRKIGLMALMIFQIAEMTHPRGKVSMANVVTIVRCKKFL